MPPPSNQDIPAQAGAAPAERYINIPMPDKLDTMPGKLCDAWPKWYKTFRRYANTSGLFERPNIRQVNALLFAMGKCADSILTTLKVNEETVTYKDLKDKIDAYFKVRRNNLLSRAKFNRRIQARKLKSTGRNDEMEYEATESMDVFINDLYLLAEDCEYGDKDEEFIRDRIIVGVVDEDLSDHLCTKTGLTLEEAVKIARSWEARKEHHKELREQQNPGASVDFVKRKFKPGKKPPHKEFKPTSGASGASGGSCWFCGKSRHKRSDCPAQNAVCKKCNKVGHYQKVCNGGRRHETKNVGEVAEGEVLFLGEVSGSTDHWQSTIKVNGTQTKFKLDTGAAVSVVSDNEPWVKNHPLKSPTQTLKGPGGITLPVLGMFQATLEHKGRQINEPIYVIKNQHCSLLSRRACMELQLIRLGDVEVQEVSPTTGFREEFPKLFQGLGKLKTEYKISVDETVKPFCLYTARKIPHPLLPKVKEEIQYMHKQGVISEVTGPVEWCSGIVPVPKATDPTGGVRVCSDLTMLNRAVKREVHPMKSVDESLAQLAESLYYTKLDANRGFWQLPLSPESRLLTTFITPFGRYCFNRLPFGISSAPEIFQREMSKILDNTEGVICHMDDILVHAKTLEDHDARVREVLGKLQESGLTLNDKKCQFSKTSMKFLGHIVGRSGLKVDPEKTRAIRDLPAPTNITELQRFNGMVNQLGKFIPNLATMNEPLRQLLRKDAAWNWDSAQEESFTAIKEALLSPKVLAHYDVSKPTIIAADACNTGIGAVLLQIQKDGRRRPVSFASRSLTETEQRYAVIEKEALAATWACEKFADYVSGLTFTLETDHKPLVPLLSTTDLSRMPPRILRFRLRMMRFSPEVIHVPGSAQKTADTLSRAPVAKPEATDVHLIEEVETFTKHNLSMTATEAKLMEIAEAQAQDEECSQALTYIQEGWPKYMPQAPSLKPFFENRGHLAAVDKLLIYDDRIVIPKSKRLQMLNIIHDGHLGITKCRARARRSVWWPGLSAAVEELVKNCNICAKVRPTPVEPLLPSSFPTRAWERIGMDLFDFKGKNHLLVVDYYSRWPEVRKLTLNQTAETIILHLKEIFSTHGTAEIVISDNGPQFSNEAFRRFAKEWGFIHVTSSPRYPQANGEAERMVRTVKELFTKNSDPYKALMAYRDTPLQNGLSPSELLMGRRLRTGLPTLPAMLQPSLKEDDRERVAKKENTYRENQARTFNLRHRVQDLAKLPVGDRVWVKDQNREGVITGKPQLRSYTLETNNGIIRRNRSALVPEASPSTSRETPKAPQSPRNNPAGTPRVAPPPVVEPRRSSRMVGAPRRLIAEC